MENKSPVDAIIAEAMDACALNMIAKLNTAHLSSDSSLPSDLESRFRKLKSLPAKTTTASPTPAITSTRSLNLGKEKNVPPAPSESIAPSAFSNGSDGKATGSATTSLGTPCDKREMPRERAREIKVGGGVRAGEEEKSKKPTSPDSDLGSGFSPIKRRDLSPDRSQARVGCCFFLSPKRSPVTPPKSRGKHGNDGAVCNMDLGEEELDDMRHLRKFCASLKEEQKKLKKALEKQQKVRKETSKLVRMAEDTSDRMRVYTDELFSDLDENEDELSGTQFH